MTNTATSNAVRRRMLGLSLHAWEDVMTISLALAGVFALAVGVATYCVVQLQRADIAASRAEFLKLAREGEALKGETARAHERTAELEKDAAGLKAQAEADRLARIKLEQRLAPRSLSLDQRTELAAKLAPFKGVRGKLVASPSTPEGERFASELLTALHMAGWEIKLLPGTPTATMIVPTGVVVMFPFDRNDPSPMMTEGRVVPPPGPWAALIDGLRGYAIEASAVPWISPMATWGIPSIEAPDTIAIVISSER